MFVFECTCLVLSMSVNVDQCVSVWVTISDVHQHCGVNTPKYHY